MYFSSLAPYDPRHSSRDSIIKAYWIESVDGSGNTPSSGYPLPMAINYNIQQSGLLTDDLLTEMVGWEGERREGGRKGERRKGKRG